jgi:hypothetical protein
LTKLTVEMSDADSAEALAAEANHLTEHGPNEEAGTYELKVELDAVYDSHAEHGRALASLLLAIHRWLEDQGAPSVDVVLDGRRFTIRAPENPDESEGRSGS